MTLTGTPKRIKTFYNLGWSAVAGGGNFRGGEAKEGVIRVASCQLIHINYIY